MQFQQTLFEKRHTRLRAKERKAQARELGVRERQRAAGLRSHFGDSLPSLWPAVLGSTTRGKVQRVTQWDDESCGTWTWGVGEDGARREPPHTGSSFLHPDSHSLPPNPAQGERRLGVPTLPHQRVEERKEAS